MAAGAPFGPQHRLQRLLRPDRGQVSFHVTTPRSHLNGCHLRPVNGYPEGTRFIPLTAANWPATSRWRMTRCRDLLRLLGIENKPGPIFLFCLRVTILHPCRLKSVSPGNKRGHAAVAI